MKKIRWLYSIFLFFGLFFCVLFTSFTANAESIRTIKNGNWSDPSVWDLGRIPTENDSVEINNELMLTNSNQIVDKLKVNQNAILKDYSLKVNTKLINNGQIKTSIYLKGNAEINGNIDGYLNLLNGANSIFSGNGTIGNLSISQNATIGGNIKVNNFYSSSSSNTTFLDNTNIEISGYLNLNGKFSNGELVTFKINSGNILGNFSGNIKTLIINGETTVIAKNDGDSIFNFNEIIVNGLLKPERFHYGYWSKINNKGKIIINQNANMNVNFETSDLINYGKISNKGIVNNNFLNFGTINSTIEVMSKNDIINNGNISGNLYIKGKFYSDKDINGYLYLSDGANSIISGNGTIGNLSISQNATIGGNIKVNNFYSSSSSNTTFLDNTNIEISGYLNLNGKFSNGELVTFKINSGNILGNFSGNIKTLIINGETTVIAKNDGDSIFNFNEIIVNGLLKPERFHYGYWSKINNKGKIIINQNANMNVSFETSDLINYGKIRNYITIKQNIENTSNKINYITFSWEEEKNENKYSSYVIKVPGEDEKTTDGHTYYFSRRNLKKGGTTFPLDYQNEYWEVYGIRKSDGARELLKRKCINVVGCIKNDEESSNFDYSNPITSNNSKITQKNIPSIAKTAIEYAKITNNSIVKGVNTSLWKQKENNITQNLNEKNAGDPVELSSGEFVYENTLINRKGIGLDFKFDVYYKNQSYYNGPIGYKFDFNYNKFLLENEDGSVNYHDGKLGMINFTKNEDGSYNYNKNLKAKLIKQDLIYKLVFDDGKKFSFSENLKISKIEDSFGNNIIINYSGDKISQITDTIGNNYLFAYYDDSRIKEIISSPTEKVRFVYYAENEEEGNKYDLKNIQLFSGDDIKEIKFTYTKNPDEKLAHNIVKLYDLNGNIYVENTYENNRVISQKYGDGTINYAYTLDSEGAYVNQNKVTNKSGNVTIYNYDKNGNTLSMLVKGKTESEDVLYSHQYSENGKLSKDINPNQSGTKYIYDNKGNLIEKRQKADINAEDSDNDLVFKYEYNDKNILTKTINPYGIIVENVYGDKQELVKTITKASSFDDIVTRYTYDDRGNVITKIDSIGQTHYEYDEKGNLTKTIKVGETEEQNITVSFEYDEKGNLSRKTDELGNQTNYEYDNFNNLIKTIEANGLVSEFEYDNQNNKTKTKILLPNDEIINSIFEYDVLDNPTKTIVDIDQNTTKGTITKYNPDGKIVSIKKESEAEITYKYNIFEKVIQKDIVVNPDDPSQNITEKYEYDSVGNLVKTINPRNHITNYEYDKFNRLTKIIDVQGVIRQISMIKLEIS